VRNKLANLLEGVEAVFFDLFDTLVEVVPDRLPTVESAGGEFPSTVPVLFEELHELRPDLEEVFLLDTFSKVTAEVVAEKEQEGWAEIPAQVRFERVLARLDLGLDETETSRVARRLTILHMQTIARCVRPVVGAERLLMSILRLDRELALVSNLDHAPAVRWILEQTNLARFFDARIVSEDLGVRKPHEKMFREALAVIGIKADGGLHIGDDPIADVWGAGRVGLQTVWINPRGIAYPRDEYPPTHTVSAIRDLFA
jgi:FMN phosphatase YigB (HAD superfamily)